MDGMEDGVDERPTAGRTGDKDGLVIFERFPGRDLRGGGRVIGCAGRHGGACTMSPAY